MKHLTRLFLAAALVCALAVPAMATDIRFSGEMNFAFGKSFEQGDSREHYDFLARQRVRAYVEFIVSEQLQGMLSFQIGEANWGNVGENTAKGQGFSMGGDGVNIGVMHAYLDWLVPNTALRARMGLQPIALPDAVAGNPVLDDDMAGIMLSYEFSDQVALTAFWAQLFEGDDKGLWDSSTAVDDDTFVLGLVLPISLESASITPYAMYAHAGANSSFDWSSYAGEDIDAWWVGVSAEINVWDPLLLKFDGIYGSLDGGSNLESDGFWLAFAADYALDSCTPGFFAFYGSGSDKDGEGWMPTIAPGGFGPTSAGMDGSTDILPGGWLSDTGIGMWGVGVQIADISFIEDLTHVVRLAYYRGTNHRSQMYSFYESAINGDNVPVLTRKDWAWEINIDSTYDFYDNLQAVLELGYVGTNYKDDGFGGRKDLDGIFKIALGLNFTF